MKRFIKVPRQPTSSLHGSSPSFNYCQERKLEEQHHQELQRLDLKLHHRDLQRFTFMREFLEPMQGVQLRQCVKMRRVTLWVPQPW